jgi:hypothetical protein
MCAYYMGWNSLNLPSFFFLLVSALLEKSIKVEKYVKDCVIEVRKEKLPKDLIIQSFEDDDLILDMNWMFEYYA